MMEKVMRRLVVGSFVKFASIFTLIALSIGAPAHAEGAAKSGTPANPETKVTASNYVEQWGPGIGTQLPTLGAADQTGAMRTLNDLAGPKGLLIFYYRSADW